MPKVDAFRSEEERIFWSFVEHVPEMVPEFEGLQYSHGGYESITFHFGEVSYTPDFVVVLLDPVTATFLSVVFEIKGSKEQKGYKETRQRLNTAAGIYTEHVFVECMVDRQVGLPSSFEIIRNKPFFYMRRL